MQEGNKNNPLDDSQEGESIIAFFMNQDGKPDFKSEFFQPVHKLALLGIMELTIEKIKNEIKSEFNFLS